MDTLYQMIKRFIMAWVWLPFLAVTLGTFAIDGTDSEKSQPDQFRLSPAPVHRYSLYIMLGSVYLLFIWALTLRFRCHRKRYR